MTDVPEFRRLSAAIRRGDEVAFARFYDLYGFRIYKFVLVLVRGDEAEAREVTQGILIKLTRGIPDFDEEPAMLAWLYRLSKNSFIDHYRKRQRQNRHTPLEGHQEESLEGGVPLQQLSEFLREALELLSPDERELIQEVYLDRRSIVDLAAERQQTYKAVESKLARLRQRLKVHLLTLLGHGK